MEPIRYQAKALDLGRYDLGEGPLFDPRFCRLSWVDIPRGRLWTRERDGKKTCFQMDQPIGAAAPLADSEGFLLAARDGLYRLEEGKASLVYDLRGLYKPYWRSNDAKADPRGRLFFGAAVDGDLHPAEGNLYCFDGKNVACMQAGTKISNGMAWSADQRRFYFSDSLEYAVFVYDYDGESGRISNRRVLFRVEGGVPDGMCIDGRDNLWVAVWGGRRVEHRSGATGELLAVVDVPAEHVSCCCLGEDGELLITSSGEGLTGPFDGCLFSVRVDAAAPPLHYAKLK